MKNSKSLLAIAFSVLLFSCSNNESVENTTPLSAVSSTYEIVAPTALPTAISSYIASNYAKATTTEVNLVSDGSYVAYLTQASGATSKSTDVSAKSVVTKLIFTAKGAFVSAKVQTMVAIADLLPAIKNYIAKNYAGATINSAHSESDGGFDVLVTAADGSKVKLNFKADGTFVAEKALKATGNHKHSHSNNHTPVALADLLPAIKTYIDTNYAGATIRMAHKESDGTFDVFVATASGAKLNINFSVAGDFVAVSSDDIHHSDNGTVMPIADLPATITAYIASNYAGATTVAAKKELDGSISVNIVKEDGLKLELKFDATGTFVSLCSHSNNRYPSNEAQIAIDTLPAAIKTYLTTNYAGATIKDAKLKSDGSYDIEIVVSGGAKLKLKFSATGTFLGVKN
jgi:hypothetical protein